MTAGETLRFLDFELRTATQELCRTGECAQLPPRSFALLECLARNPGEILTKERLLEEVWADRTVEPSVLKTAVLDLRKRLDDHDKDRPIIRTVVRRGYVFVPSVEGANESAQRAAEPPGSLKTIRRWLVAASALLALLILWPESGDRGDVTAAERIAVLPGQYPVLTDDQAVFGEMLRGQLLQRGLAATVTREQVSRTLASILPADQTLNEAKINSSIRTVFGADVSISSQVSATDGGWRVEYLVETPDGQERGLVEADTLDSAAWAVASKVSKDEPGPAATALDPEWSEALRAELSGRSEDAIALYENVLRRDPAHLDAKVRLAKLLARSGYLERALALHESILGAPTSDLTMAREVMLLSSLASVQRGVRQLEAAAATFARIDRLDVTALPNDVQAEVVRERGMLARARGEVDEARRLFARARSLLSQLDRPAQEIELYNSLGSLEFHYGNLRDAVAHYQAGIEIARKYELLGSERRLSRNMASALRGMGRWNEADQALNTALRQAKFLGDVRGQAYTALSLSLVKLALGDGQAAVETGLMTVNFAESLEDWLISAHGHDVVAEAFATMGDIERATQHFDAAIEHAERIDSPNDLWLFKIQKADALYAAGVAEAPTQLVLDALAVFEQSGTPAYRSIGHFYLGEYAAATGNCDPFEESLAIIEGRGQYHLEAETALTFADCLIDRGNHDRAQKLVDNAGLWKSDYYLYEAVAARLHWARNQHDEAVASLNRAKALAGDHWSDHLQKRLIDYTAAAAKPPST